MTYSGGTQKAQEFLSKYKQRGLIIDVYSNEGLDKIKNVDKFSVADFVAYKKKFGDSFINHMLLINTAWYDEEGSELREDFLSIYPKYRDYLKDSNSEIYFEPQFILINLFTRQILLAGLGRRHELFLIDAETGDGVGMDGAQNISASSLFSKSSGSYLDNFLSLDHSGIIRTFLWSLYGLGKNTWHMMNGITPYQYEMMLALEPNSDGMYETEEGEILSQEEYDDLIEEHEDYKDQIEIDEDFLQKFWWQIDYSTLCDG